MPKFGDKQLRTRQYGSGANLNARVSIHKRFSTNPYGWQRWVFDRLLQLGGGEILEIGCGVGAVWEVNAERVPPTWRVTLSDFSMGMIAESRQVVGARGGAFRYAACDARWLPFNDGSCDAVVANHMLYHVPDRPAALREVARVLRRGGHFIATTNGENHLRELDGLARRHGFAMEALSSAPFTLENGEEQLRQIFADVSCEHYDDNLQVTEAEPLVAYVLSTFEHADIDAVAVAALRADAEDAIKRDGFIHIMKDAGLFRATRARSWPER